MESNHILIDNLLKMKYSTEQVARIVSALFLIAGFFGYKSKVSETELVGAIDTLVITGVFLVAFVADVFGYLQRWRKGDVNAFGKRIY